MRNQTKQHPIFEKYSLNEIAEKTHYSFAHLLDTMNGRAKPSEKFRVLCSAVFKKKESDLFNMEDIKDKLS